MVFEVDNLNCVLMPMDIDEWRSQGKIAEPVIEDGEQLDDEPEGLTETLTDNGFDNE